MALERPLCWQDRRNRHLSEGSLRKLESPQRGAALGVPTLTFTRIGPFVTDGAPNGGEVLIERVPPGVPSGVPGATVTGMACPVVKGPELGTLSQSWLDVIVHDRPCSEFGNVSGNGSKAVPPAGIVKSSEESGAPEVPEITWWQE